MDCVSLAAFFIGCDEEVEVLGPGLVVGFCFFDGGPSDMDREDEEVELEYFSRPEFLVTVLLGAGEEEKEDEGGGGRGRRERGGGAAAAGDWGITEGRRDESALEL